MSDEPDPPGGDQEHRELLARLRVVAETKDAEVRLLRAEPAAERELRKRLELQVAELQRRPTVTRCSGIHGTERGSA